MCVFVCKQTSHRLTMSLSRTGVSFHLAQIRYYTTRFNRLLLNLGTYQLRFLRVWFNAGVVFGLVAMVMSMPLLGVTVVNMLSRQPTEQQILVPVVSSKSFTFICGNYVHNVTSCKL